MLSLTRKERIHQFGNISPSVFFSVCVFHLFISFLWPQTNTDIRAHFPLKLLLTASSYHHHQQCGAIIIVRYKRIQYMCNECAHSTHSIPSQSQSQNAKNTKSENEFNAFEIQCKQQIVVQTVNKSLRIDVTPSTAHFYVCVCVRVCRVLYVALLIVCVHPLIGHFDVIFFRLALG